MLSLLTAVCVINAETEGVATATKTEHDMAHRTLSKQEGKKRTLRTKAVSPEELTVTYGHVTSGLGVFVDKEMDRHEVWMKVGGASQGMDVAAVFYPEHNGYTVVRVVHGT
jgi:hypothetical protein